MTGRFYGVGVGPGDPELMTVKAARLVAAADVVAYHCGVGKQSNARRIAADLIAPDAIEEELRYPVTSGTTDHPGGYPGALADFYEEAAGRLAGHLEQGRDVVLLAEGDPLFYGSFMYMHDRLAAQFHTEIVPGVTSISAASAAASTPLARQTDVLTVLPGTLPTPELARRLADADAAVVMKLGRTFPSVVEALERAGRLEHAVYVERASMAEQRILPVKDVDPEHVPYFSVVLVPGDSRHGKGRRSRAPGLDTPGLDTPLVPRGGSTTESSGGGSTTEGGVETPARELLVVGLGPGPDHWLTPEVQAALAEVQHVVGYAPYVDRVPKRVGLERHASGNTVELDRARLALDLARRGERVAVVSGGDAGVFGMAAAVFEAAEDPAYADVRVRVLPGVSAVQAVAARAGAPIGGDFAVLSLSDRLKPWSLVEQRLRSCADADLVVAIYNPASRSRQEQVGLARSILLEHLPAGRVVVVGRDVGRAEESLTVTTLGDLDPEKIDMKSLVIVGSSHTQVTSSGRVWTSRSVSARDPGRRVEV